MELWRRALLGLGWFKAAIGLLVAFAGLTQGPEAWTSRLPVLAFYVASFGLAAGLLLLGTRRNAAGEELGATFLLIATTFAEGAIRSAPPTLPGVGLLTALGYLQIDAFLPYVVWRFVGAFPRVTLLGRWRRVERIGLIASLWVGAALFVANLAMYFGRSVAGLSEDGVLGVVRRDNATYYWQTLFALELGAFVFGLLKTRFVSPEERRRVRLFVAAFALGAAPALLAGFAVLFSPRFANAYLQPGPAQFAILLVLDCFMLSIPFTTSYAVLVHRVIPLRGLLRRAIHYALARYTVMAAVAVPFSALCVLLYRRRDQTLAELFSGPSLLVLATLAAIATTSLRWRSRLLVEVDRRFFRELYDARQILVSLAGRARQAPSADALGEVLLEEIDRALHLETLEVLLPDDKGQLLVGVSGRIRGLPIDSSLARVAREAGGPVELDLETKHTEAEGLTREDRNWVADGAFRLLVPILGSSQGLLGMVALGEKRSGLPFTKEDLLLLEGICGAASLRLERDLTTPQTSSQAATLDASGKVSEPARLRGPVEARECSSCGRVQAGSGGACLECGGATARSQRPLILGGKFRFERKIGEGGMGVVYLATDLDLDRAVAIKTLPSGSASRSMRLRREARAMASVTHPNLALIYGAESWLGQPMLVLEYLAGGTLADRLEAGPLAIDEALRIATSMADVLRVLHGNGILHRDIKPRNIGFTEEGQPKLLDFGLARMMLGAAGRSPAATDGRATEAGRLGSADRRPIVGTVPYLSPEALSGAEPDDSFDLWSLGVVLFESLTTVNPFLAETHAETRFRIHHQRAPALRALRPECSEALERFLALVLSPDRGRRPGSAAGWQRSLATLSE